MTVSILPAFSVAFYLLGLFRLPFVAAGFILQVWYLSARGLDLGRLPIVGPHDTLFFMSASSVLFAFPLTANLLKRRHALRPVIALAVLFALMSMLYKPHNTPLPPVLKTFWFEVHVALSFFAYALFGIGSVLGISLLTSDDPQLEPIQYKTILVGYFLFSAAMVFGGVWAHLAWGTYWLWTPKELWTVILWIFYSLYLHARLTRGWTGKPAVSMGIIGFAIVLFTYLGVSLFMKSSHTF